MSCAIERIKKISKNSADKITKRIEQNKFARRMEIVKEIERAILKCAKHGLFQCIYNHDKVLTKEQCDFIDKYFTSKGYNCETIDEQVGFWVKRPQTTIKWEDK